MFSYHSISIPDSRLATRGPEMQSPALRRDGVRATRPFPTEWIGLAELCRLAPASGTGHLIKAAGQRPARAGGDAARPSTSELGLCPPEEECSVFPDPAPQLYTYSGFKHVPEIKHLFCF